MTSAEWFATWFDSPYYHLLYQNRDEQEASDFIHRLCKALNMPSEAEVLDLACGKGRHSKTLAELGYLVHGIDLSQASILEAKKFEAANLKFDVWDMREVYKTAGFDYVFNLFTSFGYFEVKDNQRVVQAMRENLKPGGGLVIDFMNAVRATENLVLKEEKEVGGVIFSISRKVENGVIVKKISFEADGRNFDYAERVQALELHDFEQLLHPLFSINEVWGSYDLENFDAELSDRLILQARAQ